MKRTRETKSSALLRPVRWLMLLPVVDLRLYRHLPVRYRKFIDFLPIFVASRENDQKKLDRRGRGNIVWTYTLDESNAE